MPLSSLDNAHRNSCVLHLVVSETLLESHSSNRGHVVYQ